MQVLGSVTYPFPGTTDISFCLLQAQSSGTKVTCPAVAGNDLVNCVRQAAAFGLPAKGIRLTAPITYINDVHGIGLPAAQGLLLTGTFGWNFNGRTRSLTRRVKPAFGSPRAPRAGTTARCARPRRRRRRPVRCTTAAARWSRADDRNRPRLPFGPVLDAVAKRGVQPDARAPAWGMDTTPMMCPNPGKDRPDRPANGKEAG